MKAQRNIVIGDVHGCYKTLKKLLFENLEINRNDNIFFLGDLINRGPDSKKVLNLILKLLISQYNIKCLIGNHEYLLLKSIYDNNIFDTWQKQGGEATLKSFNVKFVNELPKRYLIFLNSLYFYYELEEYFLVHGGFNFKIDNPLEDTDSMCFIRNKVADISKIKNKKMIVGHTPSTLDLIEESIHSNIILLDGGCYHYKSNPNLGLLVAYEINSKNLYFEKCID